MPEETEKQRKGRHGSMAGVAVTLPDGSKLVVDEDGRPVRFEKPKTAAAS